MSPRLVPGRDHPGRIHPGRGPTELRVGRCRPDGAPLGRLSHPTDGPGRRRLDRRLPRPVHPGLRHHTRSTAQPGGIPGRAAQPRPPRQEGTLAAPDRSCRLDPVQVRRLPRRHPGRGRRRRRAPPAGRPPLGGREPSRCSTDPGVRRPCHGEALRAGDAASVTRERRSLPSGRDADHRGRGRRDLRDRPRDRRSGRSRGRTPGARDLARRWRLGPGGGPRQVRHR